PQTHQVEHATATVNSLLSADGIRFMLTSMVRNFMNFGPVGIILVVMIGVGLAEQAGLMTAFIKKIVQVTPRKGGDLDSRHPRGVGEHCCRRRILNLDSARSRRVPEPRPASPGRTGGGIFRRCCRLRRQFSDRADRPGPDGNHQ
ncbi:MAG: AbgT family transporter, partial [Alphaproteobacteria bacterium]|nr:AbgT family transporter [Alphaproteobacteria bacterium]